MTRQKVTFADVEFTLPAIAAPDGRSYLFDWCDLLSLVPNEGSGQGIIWAMGLNSDPPIGLCAPMPLHIAEALCANLKELICEVKAGRAAPPQHFN